MQRILNDLPSEHLVNQFCKRFIEVCALRAKEVSPLQSLLSLNLSYILTNTEKHFLSLTKPWYFCCLFSPFVLKCSSPVESMKDLFRHKKLSYGAISLHNDFSAIKGTCWVLTEWLRGRDWFLYCLYSAKPGGEVQNQLQEHQESIL